VVDGTLIPTREHRPAARSKNYRWSCNAQVHVGSCPTERGVDIVGVEPGSNTPLLASRAGGSCVTIAVAAVTSRIRSRPSLSYTTPP
jgi:hypothetical protein